MEISAQKSMKDSIIKKAVKSSLSLCVTLIVTISGVFLAFFEPNFKKAIIYNVLYSGVTPFRYIVLFIVVFFLLFVISLKWHDSTLKLYQRINYILTMIGISSLFFFAGAFFKAPFLSTTYFMKDYHGPVETIIQYAGVEVEVKSCVKIGFELECSFKASNLLPKDTTFSVGRDSFVIDHKDSSSSLKYYYVGEITYSGYDMYNKRFLIPLNGKRDFKLVFTLSSDEKMVLSPLVSFELRVPSNPSKQLNFRNIQVTGY